MLEMSRTRTRTRLTRICRRVNSRFRRARYVVSTVVRHPRFREAPVSTVWRLAVWTFGRRRGTPGITVVPYLNGTELVIPPTAWQMSVFREHIFTEPELRWMQGVLEPGMVVADVGAHLGSWAVAMAESVGPQGRVIAIEPASQNWNCLTRTISRNNLRQIQPHRLVLSDHSGTIRLYLHGDSSMNSVGPVGDKFEELDTVTLDSLLGTQEMTRLDALKIDVEGAEELVLRGATSCLDRYRPIVIFETNPAASQRIGLHADGVWNLLLERGYKLYLLGEDHELLPVDDFTKPEKANNAWNVIGIHPGVD